MVVNGKDVVDAVTSGHFDLVLLDVQMPVLDGLSAARSIRTRCAERAPYLVAVTADAAVGDRALYLAAGMDEYLGKPFRVHELVSVIERCGQRIRTWPGG